MEGGEVVEVEVEVVEEEVEEEEAEEEEEEEAVEEFKGLSRTRRTHLRNSSTICHVGALRVL